MNNKLFSIIVPVYKVEKYLNECVDSLLNQTYKDFEIILVDDGSPDNCPKICDEYAKKDEKIKVVHKQNGGLSSARNAGVLVASGRYLLFVDSDDYYGDCNFLYLLSEHIKENSSQLINFPLRTFLADTGEFYGDDKYLIDEEILKASLNKKEQLEYLIKNDKFRVSACTYAIDRVLFLQSELFFEDNLLSEDVDWAIKLMLAVNKISFLNAPGLYSRRGREGSITSTVSNKYIDDLFYIIKKYVQKFNNSNEEIERLLLNYVAYQFTVVLGELGKIKNRAYKKKTLKSLEDYKFLLNYNLNPKVQKVAKLFKLLGFKITAKILQLYLKYRGR